MSPSLQHSGTETSHNNTVPAASVVNLRAVMSPGSSVSIKLEKQPDVWLISLNSH